jgi:hypothetical protein
VINDGWASGQPLVDASLCWWGNASGPTNSSNPGGTGTPVSAGVNFSPWMDGPLGTPALSLAPAQGAPGASLSLSGTGFGPNETVTIKWNCASSTCSSTTVLGTVTTDANGDFFNLSVQVPANVPSGSYPIGALGGTSGNFASLAFTIQPGLSLSASSAPQGATIQVSGSGYGPNETVTIKWNCAASSCTSTVVLGTVTTDANGSFSKLSIQIPTTALYGSYPIGGLGGTSAGFASVTFSIQPKLTLTTPPRPNGPRGDLPAKISGSGFGANETVTILWNCGSSACTSTTVLGTVTTDANGDFSNLSISIPRGQSKVPIGAKGATSQAFASVIYLRTALTTGGSAPSTLALQGAGGAPFWRESGSMWAERRWPGRSA